MLKWLSNLIYRPRRDDLGKLPCGWRGNGRIFTQVAAPPKEDNHA